MAVKLIHPMKKRMKCEIQGCRQKATYGFGIKGIDLPVCDTHFNMLKSEMYGMMGAIGNQKQKEAREAKAKEAEVKVEEKKIPEVAKEIKFDKIDTDEPKEYYTCKYCGKKFDKSETTNAQFMTHCRMCKKEHE